MEGKRWGYTNKYSLNIITCFNFINLLQGFDIDLIGGR